MRFSAKGILRGLILGVAASLLAACGGGGGGGGSGGVTPSNEYVIELTADRTALPLNISGEAPNIGGPYTATLYVQAFRKNTKDPIPGGENIFACNIVSGLASGALYYLDGDDEHEDDDGNPLAFRSVTLGANAGAASFHFHAGSTVDSGTIRCAVTDPQSNTSKTATINISVGGTSTGKPSQVVLTNVSQGFEGFLFRQGLNQATQLVVQANVVDEAGQLVSGANSLFAQIVTPNASCSAGLSATLISGASSGKSVIASTINGQAQFTIVSGSELGNICVEFYADRSDNNVANGIVQAVFNSVSVPVVDEIPTVPDPLVISTTSPLPTAFLNTPYVQFLAATGGVPEYTWSLASGSSLPAGLTLSEDGVISGTPTVAGANFSFAVTLTDSTGVTVSKSFTITVAATGGSGITITTTSLPGGTFGLPYAAILQASGGTLPYTWSMSGSVPGLSLNASTGVLSGTPTSIGPFPIVITVTDKDGKTASINVTVTIAEPD